MLLHSRFAGLAACPYLLAFAAQPALLSPQLKACPEAVRQQQLLLPLHPGW